MSDLTTDQLQYIYSKRRKEFGRKCNFKRNKTSLVDSIPAVPAYFDKNFLLTNPVETGSQMEGGHFSECDEVKINLMKYFV
jgi:hypothetical protein